LSRSLKDLKLYFPSIKGRRKKHILSGYPINLIVQKMEGDLFSPTETLLFEEDFAELVLYPFFF